MEDGEVRSDSGTGPRIVRVGTHALTEGSGTKLRTRLSQHHGQTKKTPALRDIMLLMNIPSSPEMAPWDKSRIILINLTNERPDLVFARIQLRRENPNLTA